MKFSINEVKKIPLIIIILSLTTLFSDDSTKVVINENICNHTSTVINEGLVESLPFRGENNLYYTLFPGVTSQDFRGDELLHIRGSRHDEIGYYINGIDIRSDYTGTPLFRIIPQALNSVSIDKAPSVSTSSARAVVMHELRQGGKDYSFSINGESDQFTQLYEQRLGTYSYGYNNLTLTGGGTIPSLNTQFFIVGERELFDDHYRMFWDGFHITKDDMDLTFISDRLTIIDYGTGEPVVVVDTFTVIGEKDEILIKPGNIPYANSGRTSLNGIITQPFANGSISFIALYEDETKRINNTPIFHMFNEQRLPETHRNAQIYSLQGEYNFPNDLKLNLQTDFLRSKQSTYDPNFGDDFLKYSDSTALANQGLPYISNARDMQIHNFFFNKYGSAITGFSKQVENYNNFKFRITKPIGNHSIEIGGNFKLSKYRFYSVSVYVNENLDWILSGGWTFEELQRYTKSYSLPLFWAGTEAVGYDMIGNKVENEWTYFDAPIKPRQTALYISDYFHSGKWVVEMGLRFEALYTDTYIYSEDSKIWALNEFYNDPGDWDEKLNKQDRQIALSPRIAVNHHTTKNLSSYFSFGKYNSFPQYNDVFTDKQYRDYYNTGSGHFNNDLRAWNAKPVISYQTSLGLNYGVNSNAILNAELYTINTSRYLQTGNKNLILYDRPTLMPFLISDGESRTNGFELNFKYKNKHLETWINYNYSHAKGTSSYPISNYPLTWDEEHDSTVFVPSLNGVEYDNKHSAVGFVSYKFGENKNILLRNITLSTLGRFDSGHPYILWEAGFG